MFDTLIVFLKEFFETVIFEKKSVDDNKELKFYRKSTFPVHNLSAVLHGLLKV